MLSSTSFCRRNFQWGLFDAFESNVCKKNQFFSFWWLVMPNWKSIYAWGGHCIFPRFYAPMTHKIVEFTWCILTLKIAEKSGNIRHACKTLKEENDGNSMYALAPIKWNFSESAWHLACNSMENLQNRTKAKPNEWNNNYDFKIFILVFVIGHFKFSFVA